MQTYREFQPSAHDTKGLGLSDRQDWLVLPCLRTRDSDALDESNFHAALRILGGESETVETHRFGHWACGWLEIILVAPEHSTEAASLEDALDTYPVLDEHDFSEREYEAANETWRECYDTKGRIAYIRAHRADFEFRSLAALLGCVRGGYFAGDSSLILRG